MRGYASLEQLIVNAQRHPSGLLLPPGALDDDPAPYTAPGAIPSDLPAELRPEPPSLLVPEPTASPAEEMVLCAVTPSELRLPAPSLDDAVELIAAVPFEPAMMTLSLMAAELYHHSGDRPRQLEIARELFADNILDRIEAFVRENESHLVFDARHVAALQRLLVVFGGADRPDASFGQREARQLGGALLAVSEALPQGDPPEPEEGEDPDVPAWLAYTVRVGAWHHDPDLPSAIAHAHALYVDVHNSAHTAGYAARCDVEEWMTEDYGLRLAQQVAGGLACAVRSRALEPNLDVRERAVQLMPGFLVGGGLAEHEERLVRLISASREELASMLAEAGQTPAQIAWDHTAFERFPFVRRVDGSLRLLSPRGLAAWMTRGLHHRILQAAERRPHPRKLGRTRSSIYLGYAGVLGEEATRRQIARSHQMAQRANGVRIYGEIAYEVGNERRMSPDVALDFGTSLVLVEICSGRIPLAARAGTGVTDLTAAVDKLVSGKLRELTARTLELRDGHLRYPDFELHRALRIHRLLVLAGDPITQTPLLWTYLRSHAPTIFLDDPRFPRPVIANLDDLEPILALTEDGQHLPNLLDELLASSHADLPPRNWISSRFRTIPRRPAYVREQWTTAIREVRTELFPDSARSAALADGSQPGIS